MPARKPRRREGERKSDATRRVLLERALELFQKRGVERTTMRDIARAAGLSLGAAYYYFPSKEALIFAFYEQNQRDAEAIAATATGNLRERLGAVMHGKLDTIGLHRMLLTSILPHLIDPGDPLSAFSAQTREVRDRAIAIFAAVLEGSDLPVPARSVAANLLWLLQLACMLVYVHDTSARCKRTHGLVDDGLDLLVPMLPLLATPAGRALCERVVSALDRAGIELAA
jgi:AcrR family transcriptional regulator